jgi:hypothetical protein
MKFCSIYLCLLFFLFSTQVFAQDEDVKPWLNTEFFAQVKGESNGSKVRIDVTSYDKDINEAKIAAIKRALYLLIFEGFEPGPNNVTPGITKLTDEIGLYQQKQQEFEAYLTDPMQGLQKAQAKVNPGIPGSEKKKGRKKLIQATFTVEVNIENLRADLEGRKLIKPVNQSIAGYMPNLVIFPSDRWMKDHKFHSTKINQGVEVDIYDYNKALDDGDINKAITELKSKMGANFKIVNFKEKEKEIALAVAKNNALPVAKQSTPLDIYANVLAADLWIKLDIDDKRINGGMTHQKMISIEAYNPFTDNNAFNSRLIEKQTSGDNDWEISQNSIREAFEDIRPKFKDFFTKRENDGIEGRVWCTIAESAGDVNFDTKMTVDGESLKLSEIITALINNNCKSTKDGVSRTVEDGDQTVTLMKLKEVYIPVVTEKTVLGKKQVSSNSFQKMANLVAAELENKCGINTTLEPRGLGFVEIVITGKK